VAAVVRWVGSGALGSAELELVALVMAGKGVLRTRDTVVRRVVKELGLEGALASLHPPLRLSDVVL
jgi:hypothetical protein